MGWDTQINILVENINNEEVEISNDLYLTDAKTYWGNGVCYSKYRHQPTGEKILFFTYERRKYLPYWTIQEVSKKYAEQYFTVIGSSPDYICGPAGLVKILNGEIIDSYGFYERFRSVEQMRTILENPNSETIYQLFGKDKIEEKIRNLYTETNPKHWIDEKYYDNMINFTKQEQDEIFNYINKLNDQEWTEIKVK